MRVQDWTKNESGRSECGTGYERSMMYENAGLDEHITKRSLEVRSECGTEYERSMIGWWMNIQRK